ncbi:MAG: hypothetical protein ACYTG7_20675, partial [Planctomycetota bacterium]
MTLDNLFLALDRDKDGFLSREELHEAAHLLEWGWNQAPVMAVLDRLTIEAPMPREVFLECMNQIFEDPAGPYGEVLLRSTVPEDTISLHPQKADHDELDGEDKTQEFLTREDETNDLVSLLRQNVDPTVAGEYAALLDDLEPIEEPLDNKKTAMLIIDPQRSFTEGAWMRSIGPEAEEEVMPIRLAFRNCGRVLQRIKGRMEIMFSRCPFPPGSYDWDRRVAESIDAKQLYFVKPGNSILWPLTNGFRTWVDCLLERGKKHLIIGGCTLNSCVRVSAVEVQRSFSGRGLQVVVDLGLCGGRTRNYIKSSE